MIRFKWLSGDVNDLLYGGKWVSSKQNNGEFDYWFVIELVNMWDATGNEKQDKYYVTLGAVAPAEVGQKEWDSALSCVGVDDKPVDVLAQVEILHDYGTYAVLGQWSGSNTRRMLAVARKRARRAEFFFGFYMDRPQNMIGTTGWDAIKGDILAPLGRKE